MSILDRLIVASLKFVPRRVVRRVASRYVAGESIEDAVQTTRTLMQQGCCATFDVLGEFIKEETEADETLDLYLELLNRIRTDDLDANISIKLTGLGFLLDEGNCVARVRRLAEEAKTRDIFVRIDMEDSPLTTRTLDVYRNLRAEGFDNVGVVLQSYLHRTLLDIEELAPLKPSYRLCKGIYVEPEKTAYQGKEEVRENYRKAMAAMLDGGSYVGFATHDRVLTAAAETEVRTRGLTRDQYEFQMLLGVTEGLRSELVKAGHRLRVYVPFGRDWYEYSVRRLKENPALGRKALRGIFSRG